MKETEQVGIGGYAFILEKDASELMRQYISQLEAHYLAQEGGKEIMEGIEERAAELLLEKAKGGVVNRDHVQAVIDILGRPERIEADDPGPSASAADKKQKKLYRDMDNSRLGGVCSGLAAYFNIEVSWLRIGFHAYLLLWRIPLRSVELVSAGVLLCPVAGHACRPHGAGPLGHERRGHYGR